MRFFSNWFRRPRRDETMLSILPASVDTPETTSANSLVTTETLALPATPAEPPAQLLLAAAPGTELQTLPSPATPEGAKEPEASTTLLSTTPAPQLPEPLATEADTDTDTDTDTTPEVILLPAPPIPQLPAPPEPAEAGPPSGPLLNDAEPAVISASIEPESAPAVPPSPPERELPVTTPTPELPPIPDPVAAEAEDEEEEAAPLIAEPEMLLAASPGPATLAPPPDPEEARARTMARRLYFTPAGYTPGQQHAPRLIAPDRHTTFAVPRAPGDLGTVRSYFDKPSVVSAVPRPPTPLPGVVEAAVPASLALFFLCREGDPRLDSQPAGLYLREPVLLARAVALRDQVLENWLAGREPWDVRTFHAHALALASHPGTALLLCHNVARSFARGGRAIAWMKTDRTKGEYFDGARSFTARTLRGQGTLRANPFAASSIFYLLFAPAAFGTTDPGDWHRYFASAALAWYAASGQGEVAVRPATPFAAEWTVRVESARQRLQPVDQPIAYAWSYANAASFTELAVFGRGDESNRRAARVQLAGAGFGLQRAAAAFPPDAAWRIPSAQGDSFQATGSIAAVTIEEVSVRGKTIAVANPVGSAIIARTIHASVLESLLGALSPAGRANPAQVICTIEEGITCRSASAEWSNAVPQAIAETLADALGWNVLEHAARRQAALRFAPPTATDRGWSCEVDLGEGYSSWRVVGPNKEL